MADERGDLARQPREIRRSQRVAGEGVYEPTVDQLQQDNTILNLHAHAKAIFTDQSQWDKYRANDFDQFLNGFALAGVKHPRDGCKARVPPLAGRNATEAREMHKAANIDDMFKDLIDTVHPFKVHAHPCCCCLAAHVLNASMHVAGAGQGLPPTTALLSCRARQHLGRATLLTL